MRHLNLKINANNIQDKIKVFLKEPTIDFERLGDDGSLRIGKTIYKPFPTLQKFHQDDSNIRIVLGAFGSGKSTAMCAEILARAAAMPKCLDGVRRSRCLVVRNTYDELKTTSIDMWREWCGEVGIIHECKQPPIFWDHTFWDKDGEIKLQVFFLALDSEKQLRKLKSLQTSFAYINELSELPVAVLSYVFGRMGRYPPTKILGKNVHFWHGVMADTNPPPEDHWIPQLEKDEGTLVDLIADENLREKMKKVKVTFYHQPPAILKNSDNKWIGNPEAENIENLPDGYGYYFKMLQNGEEFVKVYAQGKYGILAHGLPVYTKYNDDLHSVDEIKVEKNVQIIYGVDYGRIAPAIICCQWVAGQLRVLKEFCGDHIYISDLAEECFIPWLEKNASKTLINGWYELNAQGKDDCSQTDDGRKQLHNLKLNVRAAKTNKIEPRLNAVNYLLGKLSSSGQPSILISRKECPQLRAGFLGKYELEKTRIIGKDAYKSTPVKSHPYSDIHDALQYVALDFSQIEEPIKKQHIINKTPNIGWF
jgi:hypothetical protein